MAVDKQKLLELEKKAHELRMLALDTTFWAGSAHIGGAMSAMDILCVLYYHELNIRVEDPEWEDRDRFIMSKGHNGVGLAAVLADKGFIDKEQLKTFNLTGSKLGIHLDSRKAKGVDASTGSLGHGSSIAVGTALAARMRNKSYWTYCLLGDGECNEGAVWEANMSAAHYGTTNLITFVDRNKCMIDGRTEDVMKLEPFADKWKAFGFDVIEINGHCIREIIEAIEKAKASTSGRPVVIIANTIKGEGIDSMADKYQWHYGAIDEKMYKESQKSLKNYYKKRVDRVNKEV